MTKRINVGPVPVGGGAPVSIQSMCCFLPPAILSAGWWITIFSKT